MKKFEKSTKLVKHRPSVVKKVQRFIRNSNVTIGGFYDEAALLMLAQIKLSKEKAKEQQCTSAK